MLIDNIKTEIKGGEMTEAEIREYIGHGRNEYPNSAIEKLEIEVDEDYVNLRYHFKLVPFQRIRRITGYLVGDLERFNDAKRKEVTDRVKHD